MELFVAFLLLSVVDVILCVDVLGRHGPQGKCWPGSGFYLWGKMRGKG